MADILVTPPAQAALDELSEAQPALARAVRASMDDLGVRKGEPLHIPGAPPDTPFLALKSGLMDAPVVIYRRTAPDEPGDWLVVSLLRPEQYRKLRDAEQMLGRSPAVAEIVQAVVAGTVPTNNVSGVPIEDS